MRLIQRALTFDDVLLVPAHSTVMPRDVSLRTRLTRNITLNIPLVSAAMDTVTEARLAIALTLSVGLVWSAEIFNTSIEQIMNYISREKQPAIKIIKDLAAHCRAVRLFHLLHAAAAGRQWQGDELRQVEGQAAL